jgi:hypothetical protein
LAAAPSPAAAAFLGSSRHSAILRARSSLRASRRTPRPSLFASFQLAIMSSLKSERF